MVFPRSLALAMLACLVLLVSSAAQAVDLHRTGRSPHDLSNLGPKVVWTNADGTNATSLATAPDGTVAASVTGGVRTFTSAGETRWTLPHPDGKRLNAPLVYGEDGTLYALYKEDGELVSISPQGAARWRSVGFDTCREPVPAGGRVYLACFGIYNLVDGENVEFPLRLVSLDAATGQETWRIEKPFGNNGRIVPPVVADDGSLYWYWAYQTGTGVAYGNLSRITPAGDTLWTKALDEGKEEQPPQARPDCLSILGNGNVITCSRNPNPSVLAFKPDGSLAWETKLESTPRAVLVTGAHVVAGVDGPWWYLDAETGKLAHTYTGQTRLAPTFVEADGTVVLEATANRWNTGFTFVAIKDGKPQPVAHDRFFTNGAATAPSVTGSPGHLYLANMTGLHALGPGGEPTPPPAERSATGALAAAAGSAKPPADAPSTQASPSAPAGAPEQAAGSEAPKADDPAPAETPAGGFVLLALALALGAIGRRR